MLLQILSLCRNDKIIKTWLLNRQKSTALLHELMNAMDFLAYATGGSLEIVKNYLFIAQARIQAVSWKRSTFSNEISILKLCFQEF